MERLTERDEFGNADIIGVDIDDLQLNLDFEQMNKAFENILERLEKQSKGYLTAYVKGILDAKKIVNEVAKEYNGDWIPCSERLPEIRQDCLVTVRYTGFMGMHGFWVKTGHMESENDWWGDCSGGEVIAWQPLPEPYQSKGE